MLVKKSFEKKTQCISNRRFFKLSSTRSTVDALPCNMDVGRMGTYVILLPVPSITELILYVVRDVPD